MSRKPQVSTSSSAAVPAPLDDRSDITLGVATSITSLPREILIIIFDMMYACTRNEDPSSPGAFPYAVSSVCAPWNELTALVPEFWTRIVYFVDAATPGSLAALQSRLERSGDLEIDIFLTRKYDLPEADVDVEHSCIAEAVAILGHHLSRCQSLTLNFVHSSSISYILDGFYGSLASIWALKLKCLKAHSTRDLHQELETREESKRNRIPFSLKYVAFEGYAYAHAYVLDWIKREENYQSFRRVEVLRMPNDCSRHLPSLAAVLGRDDIFAMGFEDIGICWSPDVNTHPGSNTNPPIRPTRLAFEDVSTDFINQYLACTRGGPTNLFLIRCSLRGLGLGKTYNVHKLFLTDVEGDSKDFIVFFVTFPRATRLNFTKCNGLTDEVLRQFPTVRATEMVHLLTVNIRDCPNISTSGLKDMVTAFRDNSPGQLDFSGNSRKVVYSLHVAGRGPGISQDEVTWFCANVERFYWDVKQADGREYTVQEGALRCLSE